MGVRVFVHVFVFLNNAWLLQLNFRTLSSSENTEEIQSVPACVRESVYERVRVYMRSRKGVHLCIRIKTG